MDSGAPQDHHQGRYTYDSDSDGGKKMARRKEVERIEEIAGKFIADRDGK